MSAAGGENRPLRVGIVGCGFLGRKRAASLGQDDLIAVHDIDSKSASELAAQSGANVSSTLDSLLELELDVVIVATMHDQLSPISCRALTAGSHVLVEKPAGLGYADVDRIAVAAESAGRMAKVGFNHRYHPGIARAVSEASSGRFGGVMFMRAAYGHGGRPGYEREWRADPAASGGGELVDQGMHLLDISYWLLGPLPLHASLIRTNYWDMPVEDNAVLVLGEHEPASAQWSLLHVTWTEWKNMFSLEIYCRTGKLAVKGLAGSYGPQTLHIYEMKPELGPPEIEQIDYPPGDQSWALEWSAFRTAVASGAHDADLGSSRYAWQCVEQAYAAADRERA